MDREHMKHFFKLAGVAVIGLAILASAGCGSEKRFQSLPADLQKVVLDAAKEMQTYENELFLKDEKTLQQNRQYEITSVPSTWAEDVRYRTSSLTSTGGIAWMVFFMYWIIHCGWVRC